MFILKGIYANMMGSVTTILSLETGAEVTEIRHYDGYINATKLCAAGGKCWAKYNRNQRTAAFVAELTASLPTGTQIIQKITNVGNGQRCTWVHPRIATHLASWLSPKFASDVTELIEKARYSLPGLESEYQQGLSRVSSVDFQDRLESIVRDRLCATLPGAKVEVHGIHGPIDVVSDDEVIEVKHAPKYTHALGQVLGHAESFPSKSMRIHLFGTPEELQNCRVDATNLLNKFGVAVTFEEVEVQQGQ